MEPQILKPISCCCVVHSLFSSEISVACHFLCAMQMSSSIQQCTKCLTIVHYEFILLMERVTQAGCFIRLVHCWFSGDV